MADESAPQVKSRREWGQSLTETALFLPIFLIMIAGVVEISNLVINQSRVDTAVRTATRFGGQGGIDEGMRNVLLNSITETLELDENRWDVWIMRGQVNAAGNDYITDTWEFNHIYGLNMTASFSDVNEAEIQNEVLLSLQQDGANQSFAGGLEIVGMLAFYDVPAVLGLDVFVQRFNTVRGFAVMRMTPVATAVQTNGCAVFPAGIEIGIRSIVATDDPLDPTTTDFPAPADFEYPSDPDLQPVLGDFFYTAPAPLSMLAAREGYVFVVPYDADLSPEAATFNFLRWDWYGPASWTDALAASMTWPGNSKDPCADPAAGDPGWEHPVLRCSNDNQLQREDPLRVSQASVFAAGNVKSVMQEHIDRGRTLRVPLWDVSEPALAIAGFTADEQRLAADFAIIRPLGYNLINGQDNWLLVEFIRLDRSCGFTGN